MVSGRQTDIPTYNQSAQPTAQISANVPSPSPAAFGTGIAKEGVEFGQGMEKLGTAITERAVQLQQAADKNTVIQTENNLRQALDSTLYNPDGKSGLMQQQGHNATGGTAAFDDTTQKMLEQYQKNLPTPQMQQEFQQRLSSWLPTMRNNVAKNEGAETTKAWQADISTNIDLAVDSAMRNPSPGAYMNLSNDLSKNIDDLKQWYGFSDETAKDYLRGRASKAAVGMAKVMEENGDVNGLQNFANTIKDKVNGDAYTVINGLVAPLKQKIQASTILEQIKADPAMRDAKGVLDYTKVAAKIEEMYGPNATKQTTGTGTKEDFFNAVSTQESGGNYSAENGRTGAFGKYQIMPGNWEGWKSEAAANGVDVGSGNMNDPAAQDAVAKFKLGQYYDRYGAEGALVAWYAGEANGKRWAEGAPDAIGEGGHYSWDAKQGNGNEPSVREYVQQSLGNMKTGAQTVSAYNPKEYETLLSMAKEQAMLSKAEYQSNLENAMTQWQKYIQDNPGAIKTYGQALEAAKQFGFNPADIDGAVGYALKQNGYIRADEAHARQEQAYAEKDQTNAMFGDLYNGNITTEAELKAKYGNSAISYQTLYSVGKALGTREKPNWAGGANTEAFKAATEQMGITEAEDKAMLMDRLTDEDAKKLQTTGSHLNALDVQRIVTDEGAYATINKGFFNSKTTAKDAIPPGLNRGEDGSLYDDQGRWWYKNDTGNYVLGGSD